MSDYIIVVALSWDGNIGDMAGLKNIGLLQSIKGKSKKRIGYHQYRQRLIGGNTNGIIGLGIVINSNMRM